MAALRKYGWVGLTAARSNIAYLGEVATRFIFLGVVLFIFLQLWRVTYSEMQAERLGGLTLAQMLWYLAMTEAITLSGPRVAVEVDQDVRTGALAIQIIRPLSYPLYRLWTVMGERMVRFAMNTVVAVLVVLLFVGSIPISAGGLAMWALSVPFAFVLDFLGMFLVGLGAFWMEDTSGLRLLYSRATMILGGMLIPLELFPESWQPILHVLPFSSIIYGPARLFVDPSHEFLRELLLRQSIAIALYTLIVALVYRLAVRRINANGG